MRYYLVAVITVVLAAVLYPVVDFALRGGMFVKPRSYRDTHCTILNATDFSGMEDITIVRTGADAVDLIAAFEPRRETWLNHDHVFSHDSKHKSGLLHVRVLKKKCAGADPRECIKVSAIPFALKDASVLFNPHGVYYDERAQRLYVINHAMKFGGDRIEVFKIGFSGGGGGGGAGGGAGTADSKKKKNTKAASSSVMTAEHEQSLLWAATADIGKDVSLLGLPPHLDRDPIAKPGSAFGILNDVTVDRVNNRLLTTQWRPFPLSRNFPKIESAFRDKWAPIIMSLLFNPTLFLSCPLASSVAADAPQQQCIRSSQRYALANGIISNTRGDIVFVVDLGMLRLSIERPLKIDASDKKSLPRFESLGWIASSYAADNVELHSDNRTHVCVTQGVIQRLVEPALELPANRHATTSVGATQICCPYADPDAEWRTLDIEGCSEEVLFLSKGSDGRVHSGVSVAVSLDAEWAGREAEKRLVLTGSWYDRGMSVCWI